MKSFSRRMDALFSMTMEVRLSLELRMSAPFTTTRSPGLRFSFSAIYPNLHFCRPGNRGPFLHGKTCRNPADHEAQCRYFRSLVNRSEEHTSELQSLMRT